MKIINKRNSIIVILTILITVFLVSCSNSSPKKNEEKEKGVSKSYYESNSNEQGNSFQKERRESNEEDSKIDEDENKKEDSEEDNSSECKLKDGTYSATVDYHNPETGYSQSYTLDVDVQDCEVVKINFPKGGWLNKDHISPASIDEDGNANVEGEEGKTYDVHIEKD